MNNIIRKTSRTEFDHIIEYTIEGFPHKENGPAVIWASGSMFWYKDGILHREDGPAIIWDDGNMQWYKDGIFIKTINHNIFAE